MSIQGLGLQHPITVRSVDRLDDPIEGEIFGAYVLVAGAHRLASGRSLGLEALPCRITTWGESQARRWEIAENLHRADLTTLQRNEQVAEWIALTNAETKAQVAPSRHGGRPDQGINAASRELGIERTEAQRANRIAKISPAAKDAARSAGLENNQTALLKVAAVEEGRQVAVVHDIAAARLAGRNPAPSSDPDMPFRLWVEEGRRWLNRGSAEWHDRARITLFPAE